MNQVWSRPTSTLTSTGRQLSVVTRSLGRADNLAYCLPSAFDYIEVMLE